jgi:hypothetical protein
LIYDDAIQPPMCRKHYEIALLISRLERRGNHVSVPSIIEMLERVQDFMSITPEEVPQLLHDIRSQPHQELSLDMAVLQPRLL